MIQTFTQTSHEPYNRHHYRLYLKSGKNRLDFYTGVTKNLFANMNIDFLSKRKVSYVLSAVLVLVSAILLFTKYRTHTANRYLGFLVLAYSLFITNVMLSGIEDMQHQYPQWLMILSGLPFLFGPLLK